VNLDLPLCAFLLDASETNYSGFRGAIDQARQRWREIQSWYMGSFHRPIYEWKARQWAVADAALRRAVEKADSLRASLGYIPAGEVNPFAHVWHAQELPYIQPVDDATADILQAQGLLSSPRRLAASRGIDFGDLTDEIIDDNGQRIEVAHAKAQDLNARLGLDLTWRDTLNLSLVEGVQVNVQERGASGGGKRKSSSRPSSAPPSKPEGNDDE
jgi:capsid protein